MPYLKNFFLFISILFILTNCKILIDNSEIVKLSDEKYIYIDTHFSEDVKINGKILLEDTTNDISKYLSVKDTTADLLNSGQFITNIDDINRLKHFELLFAESLKNEIDTLFEKEKLNFKLHTYHNKISDDSIILSVKIIDFDEGEFNFIRNVPTVIKINSTIYKKGTPEKKLVVIIKKYIKKSTIDSPITTLRLKEISKNVAINVVKFFKKNY